MSSKDEMEEIIFENGAIRWFYWHNDEPKKNVAWRWKMCWNRKSPQDQITDGVVTVQDFVDIWADQYGEWRCPLAYLEYLYNFYENQGNGEWTWRGRNNPIYDLNKWNKNGRWSQPQWGDGYWGITHYGNDYRFQDVRQHYMDRYPNMDWNRGAAPAARKEKMKDPDQNSWISKMKDSNTTGDMMQIA